MNLWSDTTEQLHFHFSLSCVGEGNGHPLQCSCLENPRDGGAWWAAVYGVAQSRTRLKRLSSSSTTLEARSLRSNCWQDWFLQEALRVHSCLLASGSCWHSWCSPDLYTDDSNLCLHFHKALPSLCLCLKFPFLLKGH